MDTLTRLAAETVVPDPAPAARVPAGAVSRPVLGSSHCARLLLIATLAVATGLLTLDDDTVPVAVSALLGAGRWLGGTLASVGWSALLVLSAVSAVHYAAAALAARASAGRTMPFGELMQAQLAAAAANRLTPAGLGGAALLGRFFTRRGGLRPAESVAAVSALSMLGGVADVLAFAVLISVGTLAGWSGVSGETPALLRKLTALIPIPTGTLGLLALGVVACAAVSLASPRVRRVVPLDRVITGLRLYSQTLTQLMRQPWRLAGLLLGSGGTTVVLAAGFAAVAVLGPASLPLSAFAALMVGFMVAAAAGNALPTPGGIGTADAAFVGVLLAAHASLTAAVASVLAFRLMTFWAPAALGLVSVRTLRRRQAL